MRSKHGVDPTESSSEPKKGATCYVCDKVYSSVSALNRHLRVQHHLSLHTSRTKLLCPECSAEFPKSSSMDLHLEHGHGIELSSSHINFENMDDFYAWKEETERKTHSLFVKHEGTKSVEDGDRTYYYCHRSGHSRKMQDPDRIRWKGSPKTSHYCPARLTATESNGKVSVIYKEKHVGHDFNLGHLRLSKNQRAILAAKLQSKVKMDDILDEVRDSVSEEHGLTRMHLLEKRDLLNVIREFKLDKNRAHDNDAFSVELWVAEQQEKNPNMVAYYKGQHKQDPSEVLRDEDFMIVLMTEYQKELVRKYSSDKILIDSTHGTNNYDFQLTTLMTVDEYGAGCPVAFCISNRIDTESIGVFFEAVKNQVGRIKCNVFMSDDYPAYYNAWEVVMAPANHRLLCTWHVDRSWRTQLKQKVKENKAPEVYKGCRVLLECKQAEDLEELAESFIQMCENDEETKEFGKYFRQYYANRIPMWAFSFRHKLGLNTNMYLEALHKKLKYCHFDGKANRRMDNCIAALLKLSKNLMFERLIRHHKQKPTSRMLAITESHKKSAEIKPDAIEQVHDAEWRVKSQSSLRGPYAVTLNEDQCEGCPLQCPICQICVHQVSCTCENHLIGLNICKHIHAVIGHYKLKSQTPINITIEEAEVQSITKESAHQQNFRDGVSKAARLKLTMEMAAGLALQVHESHQDEAISGADRLVKLLQKLIRTQGEDTSKLGSFQEKIQINQENKQEANKSHCEAG
ncbi:uncharacterized protein LOC117642361 [Thrips palmi]|uniref:Uncharacterized protein LOC117642361 n=1 Tax=Thrips palmi TaxID=161013 RepID=A0A6P8Y9K8_THRPL|nr:uncharacterized protein LOC117642361 [Thrips palmi]